MDKITFSVFRGHPDDSGSPIGVITFRRSEKWSG